MAGEYQLIDLATTPDSVTSIDIKICRATRALASEEYLHLRRLYYYCGSSLNIYQIDASGTLTNHFRKYTG